MVELWMEIVGLATLIGLSSFFSGLEVALVGTSDAKVNQLRKEGVKGAEALYKLKSNPGWMMSSVNLGNNLANVGSSALATTVALRIFGNDGLAIAVGLMTFLILVFGEITPKTYCNANATKVSLRFAGVLLVFSYAFWPVVKMFASITKVMVKLTGSSYHAPPITEEEIQGIVEQGLKDKALEKEETEMVRGALRFDDITIKRVMTPRAKMVSLPESLLLIDALHRINQSSHSRIPVYGKDPDDVTGYVHVKDVLIAVEGNYQTKSLGDIARKPVFVPEERTVSLLLTEMRGLKTHIAIVLDEHGGVDGLVTMEDLLETIVGDIEDETDAVTPVRYHRVDKNTIRASGEIRIVKVNKILGSSIPEGKDYVTLNGLLYNKLKKIPAAGDRLTIGDVGMEVEAASNNITEKVLVRRTLQDVQAK